MGAHRGHPFKEWVARMLTDAAAKQTKAKDKDYKLSDSGGLYLFVSKSGHKTWRLKYRYLGKPACLKRGCSTPHRAHQRRPELHAACRIATATGAR